MVRGARTHPTRAPEGRRPSLGQGDRAGSVAGSDGLIDGSGLGGAEGEGGLLGLGLGRCVRVGVGPGRVVVEGAGRVVVGA